MAITRSRGRIHWNIQLSATILKAHSKYFILQIIVSLSIISHWNKVLDALESGSVNDLEIALSNGGSPNALSKERKTSLHYALGLHLPVSKRIDRTSLVSCLLSYDLDLNGGFDVVIVCFWMKHLNLDLNDCLAERELKWRTFVGWAPLNRGSNKGDSNLHIWNYAS